MEVRRLPSPGDIRIGSGQRVAVRSGFHARAQELPCLASGAPSEIPEKITGGVPFSEGTGIWDWKVTAVRANDTVHRRLSPTGA
jgi:hypothetical protein